MRNRNIFVIIVSIVGSVVGILIFIFVAIVALFSNSNFIGNVQNESNLSRIEAFEIFGVNFVPTSLSNFRFLSDGFLNSKVEMAFNVNSSDFGRITNYFNINGASTDVANPEIDNQVNKSYWDPALCSVEAQKFNIDVPSLSYSSIIFCEISSDTYQIYMVGGNF